MNNSALDDHIKEKFAGYSPDVPPHIWENIMAEKDKRRPAGFWFFSRNTILLLLGIVITGTGIIIYKNISSSKNTPENITASTVNNPDNTGKTVTGPTTKENTNNATAETKTTTENKTPENKIDNTSNTTPAGVNPIASENIQPAGKDIKDINNKKRASSSTISINTTGNSITIDNSVASTADNNISNPVVSNKKTKHRKGAAAITFKEAETAVDDEIAEVRPDLFMSRLLLNLDMIRAQRNLTATVKQTNNPHLDIPCPEAEKNAAGNKRYFEIYAGPDYAFRSITDTANSAYLQKRKESTSFSSAFSAGLRYTRVFSNGMSFRTGINYSQINERFKYAEGNIIQVVYITNGNGDTTGSYTTTGTRYKTTYNRFRTIDIPILIGYELGNGRLHANFNAGAVVNAYSWQKGDVLDTAYKPISITTGKASSPYQFRTNVGLGLMGSISVYYKLTDVLHIFAEPYFRYNFSPASKADLTLKQKYNTAGLRLGVRLDF